MQCIRALLLSFICFAINSSVAGTLRLEYAENSMLTLFDESTALWSKRIPSNTPRDCLEQAIRSPGNEILCGPHYKMRLGLSFDLSNPLPVKEHWRSQAYTVSISPDHLDITLRGDHIYAEDHIPLSVFFWIVIIVWLAVLWYFLFFHRRPHTTSS